MAVVDTTSYAALCRLCATKTGVVLAINIFENEGAIRQVNKKIGTCLPVQIHETDELPKMICESCLYKLELFFDFRERTLRTETLLIDLYKEVNAVKLQSDQQMVKMTQSMDVVINESDLIMVQQHQLLNDHNVQTVGEIDLGHLEQRGNVIVEHEIILAHQNVNINAHSLDTIDLNHHELSSQDLSNHSLSTQEAIMVETTNDVHEIGVTRYTEGNLDLIQQHQILTEQYTLQHSLDVDLTKDEASNNKVHISVSPKSQIRNKEQLEQSDNISESNKIGITIKHCSDQDISQLGQDVDSVAIHSSTEDSKPDDNSENCLFIDDAINETEQVDNKREIFVHTAVQSKRGTMNDTLTHVATNQGDWFYCNMCGKTYSEKLEFQMHYEAHFNKCSYCFAVFTNKDALHSHWKEVHSVGDEDVKPIKTRLKRATLPIKQERNKTRVESNSDSEDVNDPDHIDDEEEYEDEAGNDSSELSNAKRKKWSPKVCKECGKAYKTNYKLTEHMRKHTGEKPYKCSSCDKAFRSKIGLAQHEAKHTGQYDLSCPTCGKGFQCKSYLMVHQRVHSDVKPYPCTTCGRNFKTKQSLLDHTNRHLGVKPYMCEICGRGFITKGLCKAHQKVHTGLDNRKYSCKVCNKMFVSKSYLQTHLRIHTGEKPFMCEVCGKGFLTRVDLRIHSTMHTGEKSYVCEMCGKAFARRDALRCHRRSHTGERPYSCDQCGQTFTQFSPMAIHKRLHTGERPYACEVCGKTFVSRSTMMSHWKKHVR